LNRGPENSSLSNSDVRIKRGRSSDKICIPKGNLEILKYTPKSKHTHRNTFYS